MEHLPVDKILEYNPDTLEAVRKVFGLNHGDMKQAVDVFQEWVQKQSHFVKKDFSRDYLERTIITAAKGSVERAKQRLDKLCTLRTLMPQFFGDWNAKEDFKHLSNTIAYTPLPKMTKDHERVYFIKSTRNTPVTSTFLDAYRFCTMTFEYLRAHDYAQSYIFVVDMVDSNLADIITKINLVEMRQINILTTEGYGARVKGIHMITTSKVIDTLVGLMKQMMSAKIGERIQVHKSMDSLKNYLPKEVLPLEYGGTVDKSLEQIHDEWIEVLSSNEYREYQRDMNTACTNEACRQTDTFNEQYMGMPGTFRTLSVD